ncbi:unnamed protein product [Hymenolepis diminuta]|uniref:Myotubularin phosphatase domain-containing protein n=1 Tax=Hymenolepis diminuta TaxID=6216 RepID=A0A564YYY4_HYMDI|nr:unnamed protein product [Hymenolepis diminuta]
MLNNAYLCGPDGFVIQGSYNVSSKGIEVSNEKEGFLIHRKVIDRLERIAPSQNPIPQSNGNSNSTQRRFGRVPASWYTLGIGTKDFLFYEISFASAREQQTVHNHLFHLLREPSWKSDECITDYPAIDDGGRTIQVFSPEFDFAEQISNNQLRISDVNHDFQVCSSYPQLVIVPESVNDSVITNASRCRCGSRFPLIKYFHAPKSTILATTSRKMFLGSSSFASRLNQSSLTNDTSSISGSIQPSSSKPELQANDQLLDAMLSPSGRGLVINLANESSSLSVVSSSNSKSTKKERRDFSTIIAEDTLPKKSKKRWHLNRSNRESSADLYDKGWKSMPKPLPDPNKIHEIFVRFIEDITTPTAIPSQQNSNAAFNLPNLLRPATTTTEEDVASGKSAFADVKVSLKKTTAWLGLVRDTLAIASTAACALCGRDRLDKTGEGLSVLLVSNEGTDRSLLISSLTQIILSADFRTIRGFAALVQRDWVAAGHPFTRRCSRLLTQPSGQLKEASPIFLLFLDCVWQIWSQYPSFFEFNEELLLLLARHVYLCDFANFIGDCDVMRKNIPHLKKKPSFWSYVNCPEVNKTIQNCLYTPPDEDYDPDSRICWPCVNPHAINVWREVYQRILLPNPCTIWSSQREALAEANSKYKRAFETVRDLEEILKDLVDMASKEDLLP